MNWKLKTKTIKYPIRVLLSKFYFYIFYKRKKKQDCKFLWQPVQKVNWSSYFFWGKIVSRFLLKESDQRNSKTEVPISSFGFQTKHIWRIILICNVPYPVKKIQFKKNKEFSKKYSNTLKFCFHCDLSKYPFQQKASKKRSFSKRTETFWI